MNEKKSITKSKILCTLGPSSSTVEQIKALIEKGMDCARINFSHGDKQYLSQLVQNVRLADETLAVLCDIQGPKIRIGKVKEGGVMLQRGHYIEISVDDKLIGDENFISISYKKLPEEVNVGDLIFINDGIVCLQVESILNSKIKCKILSGGFISTKKGVNLPSTKISLKVPTEKDVEDLKIIAQLDPEFVAVSFVGDENDIKNVRKILADFGNTNIKIIAKIERPFALQNFDSILAVSDGIMVARGDLGVEIPPEEVLPVQKEMIRKCNIAGKPIIVATQMLESMVKAPVPTRAEVSDVYNAIEDGADAVMLSAETASGEYPKEAVDIMERIIRSSESLISRKSPEDFDSAHVDTSEMIGHLVFSTCSELFRRSKGKIICLTRSGHSARMIAKYRPIVPIIGVTSNMRTVREMRLLWGIEPLMIPEIVTHERTRLRIKLAVEKCLESNLIDMDENLVIAGNFFDFTHHINMISIFATKDVVG